MGILIWFWLTSLETTPDNTSEVKSKTPPTLPTTETISSAIANDIIIQQSQSVTAAAQAISTKPIEGIISGRPDFISEIEWQSLRLVAQRNQNPAQELTRLVSNMRFNKQMEIWQSLANSADQTQRHALANQLLNDIPNAVSNQAIDQIEAQRSQSELVTDLIKDPNTRKNRIAKEALRIGVKLDIQESP
ncbi:MAG: hypothetical protein H7Z73_08980 [Candidatus Saccharibacteria bacterium]|nr:hypothetical protein [Moraxellaceae bacterium]